MTDKPHFIDDGDGPRPASTEEIAAVIRQHAWHDGIAYFADCPLCVEAREAGRYSHWFPKEGA